MTLTDDDLRQGVAWVDEHVVPDLRKMDENAVMATVSALLAYCQFVISGSIGPDAACSLIIKGAQENAGWGREAERRLLN